MTSESQIQSRRQVVEALQEQLKHLKTARHPWNETVSSGSPSLDRLLPQRGFVRGTLVEWLAAEGSGAATLALIVAREACQAGRACVVMDRERKFYPPAAAALGLNLENTLLVQPKNEKDHIWAWDQALRCPGVAAVIGWTSKLPERAFRRLQLAAETGCTLGLLMRPQSARSEPSWAAVRLLVTPRASASGRRLQLELLHCRHGSQGGIVNLEIHDETGMIHEPNSLPLAAELADPATRSYSAGAS